MIPRGFQGHQRTSCATRPRAGHPAPTHPSTASSTTRRRRRRSDPCSDRAWRRKSRTRLRRARYLLRYSRAYRRFLRALRSSARHRGAAARAGMIVPAAAELFLRERLQKTNIRLFRTSILFQQFHPASRATNTYQPRHDAAFPCGPPPDVCLVSRGKSHMPGTPANSRLGGC